MKKYFCDLCGCEADFINTLTFSYRSSLKEPAEDTADICPDCMRELKRYMDNIKKKNKDDMIPVGTATQTEGSW